MQKMNILNLIRVLNGETQHKNKKGKGKGCFGRVRNSIGSYASLPSNKIRHQQSKTNKEVTN